MSFFRTFQHLLPDARAWRLTIDKKLRRFFEGLSFEDLIIGTEEEEPIETEEGEELGQGYGDPVQFLDDVYEDAFPGTTRELVEWEKQFGLEPKGSEVARRLALAAEWAATGGQSPSYIQGVLQTAGFDVYVHEWFEPGGPPWVLRDPRDYTDNPLVGIYQCSALPSQPQCSAFPSQPQCNDWLANETNYLVNKDLTRRPPPLVPDDPAKWPYFLYIGGETFPDIAIVEEDRRAEFERLILKIRPTHNWIVTLVSYYF
jgi:hypothetical protein